MKRRTRTFGLTILCLAFWGGCSFLDRQQPPELLELRTDRGSDPSVGRGQEVHISILADDPDNDELDFQWVASGGVFKATQRDTFVDLFQDSVTVVWKAPVDVGIYELFLEVSDGQSEKLVTSGVRIAVTQAPPIVDVGPDQVLDFVDTLRVVLDGTASVDPDGDALTYFWNQVGGPRLGLENRNSPTPTFRAVAPGDYIFTLQVADFVDGVGDSSDVVTMRVRVTDRKGRKPNL